MTFSVRSIDPSLGVRTRRGVREEMSHSAFISMIEPTRVEDALMDGAWVEAMHDELNQFIRNDVWELVPRPKNHSVIGTKWVFKNKSNDQGVIIRLVFSFDLLYDEI